MRISLSPLKICSARRLLKALGLMVAAVVLLGNGPMARAVPKPWAVILCKFSDQSAVPHPASFYMEAFTEKGAGKATEFDYFHEVSYGHLDMTGSKVYGWLPMKHSTKELAALTFPGDRGKLVQWGRDVAAANSINLKPFYGVMVVFNSATDSGAAGLHQVVLGYKGADWSPTFNCHELGHGFDLGHSWSANPDKEYGDQWDIMSAMNVWTFNNKAKQASGPGMNAWNLKKLGCIGASRIWSPKDGSSITTITLTALSRPDSQAHLMAWIPPKDGSKSKTSYAIEFRQKKGWDDGIPQDTVLVHEVRENGIGYLLSRPTGTGTTSPELLPGQVFSIPARGLTIKVKSFDAKKGTATVEIGI
jgi:hypothetical protein